MSHTDETATRNAVEAFLAKAGRKVSEGDVAAGAGIPVGRVKSMLYELMLVYDSTLEVLDDGSLVYDFGPRLKPLGARTWKDRLRTFGGWLWKGFSWLYKASLAIVLVSYTIVFVVLIIAAAVAATVATKDEDIGKGAFRLVGAIFRGIFEFTTHSAIIYADTDRYGYRHSHYEPTPPVLRKPEPEEHSKGFVASVYDFVLGPERVEIDDRAQHRELASFVRECGGGLSTADIQALSGLSRDEADKLFARFVAEFDGDVEITDDGTLYARFPGLQQSATTEHDEPIVYYWDEYEAPYEVTGNSLGRNLLIAALAAFNLGCALFFDEIGLVGPALTWLGIVPTVIFGLFFAIPAVRSLRVWQQNRRQHANNIRRRLFAGVFRTRRPMLTLRELADSANKVASTEEQLDPVGMRAEFERAMRELGGDVDLHEEHDLVVDLSNLRKEIAAREETAQDVRPGAVVFSTAD